MSKSDHARKVLESLSKEINSEVPLDLVNSCYEVEICYIFETDKTKSAKKIKKLVEEFISKQ